MTPTPPRLSVDITQSLHGQIKQLAQYVNDRTDEASKMGLDITKLKLEIGEVEDAMSELNRKMQEHNDTQIQTFGDKLDIAQKFDLRWAIGGLVVSFAGAMWGLGA